MNAQSGMFVGTCLITLALHGNSSLKGKRSVVSRIKSRVQSRFNVSISEVGYQDRLQTAALGLAAAGSDRVYIEGQLNKVVGFITGLTEAEVADVQMLVERKGVDDHAFL